MVNNNPETEQQNVETFELAQAILTYGDALLVANKGYGKTNALMQLTRVFQRAPNVKVVVLEPFPKWTHEYDMIPYMTIEDGCVVEHHETLQLETDDYFVRTKRDYSVLRGNEIKETLAVANDILFLVTIED